MGGRDTPSNESTGTVARVTWTLIGELRDRMVVPGFADQDRPSVSVEFA